jgi:hypothetical protein
MPPPALNSSLAAFTMAPALSKVRSLPAHKLTLSPNDGAGQTVKLCLNAWYVELAAYLSQLLLMRSLFLDVYEFHVGISDHKICSPLLSPDPALDDEESSER